MKPEKGRFLHLIPDNKFIDAAHAIFEEVNPGGNDYIVISNNHGLKHIHSFHPVRMGAGEVLDPTVLRRFPSYSAVFIHFLSNAMRWVVRSAPENTNFAWIGWGADYYHLIRRQEDLILPKTKSLITQISMKDPVITDLLRCSLIELLRTMQAPVRSWRMLLARLKARDMGPGGSKESALLRRISIFSPVLEEEYRAIAHLHPKFGPKYVKWNYWTDGFGVSEQDIFSGRNILLGNSATHENNHLDAFDLLRKSDLGERKIFCPLSYGLKRYGDSIANEGSRRFGASFVPLRNYLCKSDYMQVVNSCSIAVMNHVRQQAMGNIILLLWQGSRVYLNPGSPVLKSLRTMGIEVGNIYDLPSQTLDERPVDKDALAEQRDRLSYYFGRRTVLNQTRLILSELASD